jgi:hypothetical protein
MLRLTLFRRMREIDASCLYGANCSLKSLRCDLAIRKNLHEINLLVKLSRCL